MLYPNLVILAWMGHKLLRQQAQVWNPRKATPSKLGDTYVPPFWPPFLTFRGLNRILLGYFFSTTNTKMIFLSFNPSRFRSFWPQIPFLPRSFWGPNFSGPWHTPTGFPTEYPPPTPPPPPPGVQYKHYVTSTLVSILLVFMALRGASGALVKFNLRVNWTPNIGDLETHFNLKSVFSL